MHGVRQRKMVNHQVHCMDLRMDVWTMQMQLTSMNQSDARCNAGLIALVADLHLFRTVSCTSVYICVLCSMPFFAGRWRRASLPKAKDIACDEEQVLNIDQWSIMHSKAWHASSNLSQLFHRKRPKAPQAKNELYLIVGKTLVLAILGRISATLLHLIAKEVSWSMCNVHFYASRSIPSTFFTQE